MEVDATTPAKLQAERVRVTFDAADVFDFARGPRASVDGDCHGVLDDMQEIVQKDFRPILTSFCLH